MAQDRSADVQGQVNALIQRDPQLQALLTQIVNGNQGARQQFEQRLASLGFQMDKDYHVDWNDRDWQSDTRGGNARIDIDRDNFFQRNADWMVPAAVGGATLGFGAAGAGPLAGLFGGGGGTAASTAIGAGGVPGLAAEGVPAIAGITGGSAAGGSAAAGGILKTLKKYSGAAGDIGGVLTGAAAGAASGRREDALVNQRAAEFNRDLPSVRTNQVARGEVLNTMQDAKPTGDPRIDKFGGGGLRPSAFGPQSRQAGAELSRQAMSGLMNPDQDRLKPSQAGLGENLAAGAGLGLSIFDLLKKYGSPQTTPYGGV